VTYSEYHRSLHYQVDTLGNLVRGLEDIAAYVAVAANRRSARVRDHARANAERILARLPPQRRPAAVLGSLAKYIKLDGKPECESRTKPLPSNTIVVPMVEDHPEPCGLVRALWIEWDESYARGFFPFEAEADFRWALEVGCVAAEGALRDAGFLPFYKIPEDYAFHIEGGAFGPNPQLRDESVWLAAALSFFSLNGGVAVPGVIAATGYIDGAGRVAKLNHVDVKIAACLRERPDVDKILVLSQAALPATYQSHPKVKRVESLEAAIAEVWGPGRKLQPPKLNLYGAMDRAKYTYAKEHDVAGALKRFELIRSFLDGEPQISERFLFRCDWRIASCYTHLGKPKQGRKIFERWTGRAAELWKEGVIDTEDYANFFASYGVCQQHLDPMPEEAEALLRRVLREVRKYRAPCLERARVAATLGNLLMRKRAFKKAERFLLDAYRRVDGEEKPKYCTFLCRLYVEWGRRHEASRYFEEFGPLNAAVTLPVEQQVNRWFNEICRMRKSDVSGCKPG
jgi:tetratricopeptide (TPR) repeat protein